MMNRRIGVGQRITRVSKNGMHWYIDPIMGVDSQKYETVNEREEEIRLHYREPDQCRHDWEELTRVRNRYEPSMCSGVQQCRICGTQAHYQKEND